MACPLIRNKTNRLIALIVLLASSALLGAGSSVAQEAFSPSFRLIGTIEGTGFAGAVLIDAAGAQTFCRLHEAAPDGSKIIAVASDSIVLKRPDGTRYELYIIHDMTAAPPSSPSAGPFPVAPGAGETRPLPPLMQRPMPGPVRQNLGAGPNSPASGADQTQKPVPRQRIHRQPGSIVTP